MSLWKLRVGVESYYLAQIAAGLDEYYTGAGEAPGQWVGTAAPLLGLDGTVDGDELRAVLAGLAPGTGLTPNGVELKTHQRRVPGFDLTFSVPKSVSVLWALGDPLVQSEVTAGCEAALAESLAWMEREACFVRRGSNNRQATHDPADFGTRRMVAEGFVAAQFPHRTSRLGDPHLHWHVLVANTARGVDGRWTALDGTALYAARRTAGVMFQAAMRRELSDRLGVQWGPTHNDSAEIAGVPREVLREFSRRHEQIAEWLDLTGRSGPQAETEALLDTRTSKKDLADIHELEAQWRSRADALGWGTVAVEGLLANSVATATAARWSIRETEWRGGRATVRVRPATFDEWLEWLLSDRVTEKYATFTRFDLTQAVAAALPLTSAHEIEATVNRALSSPAIVAIGDHWAEATRLHGPERTMTDDRALLYTSRSLLDVEQRFLGRLQQRSEDPIGWLDEDAVEAAIAASTLGDDQARAVRVLTSAGDPIDVLVGRAGTGKTHTLGTVRHLYESAGWDVIGLAPSARAARELQDGSGIASTTIARHLVERRQVRRDTLVVVDEAAMAGTRELATVVEQAASVGAKVLLVGDHHQLPEVAAGGAFRAALDTLGDRSVELTTNRRQVHAWERAALDELRCGDVTTAFNAYRDQGRVVISDHPEDVHAIALADWLQARRSGADTLLLAGTRSEARLLNRQARALLADAGELDITGEVIFAAREFVAGDLVVLCRNHPHQRLTDGSDFAVANGMRGTITDLSPDHMVVRLTTGHDVTLDREYLDHGWVDHAYAVTIHKAQGVTCDRVLVVGPAGLYREGAYVALSRARHSAQLYATTQQATDVEQHRHGIPLPTETEPDPEQELIDRLNITAAKNLVSVDDPHAAVIADLIASTDVATLLQRARHARDVERTSGMDDPAAERAAYEDAWSARTHLATGRRVRAVDRDNVGLVIDVDDRVGTCLVHFENSAGRSAECAIAWEHLVVIDRPDAVDITCQAADTLRTRRAAVETAEHRWAELLAASGIAPGEATLLARATRTAIEAATRAAMAEPPSWLVEWIGDRPTTPASAAVWDDTVSRITRHRCIHDINVDHTGLGPAPAEPHSLHSWRQLMLRVLEDRLWLNEHERPERRPLLQRSPSDLIDRQQQLQQLLATAPPDQRAFVDRIVSAQLDAQEMHDYLSSAMAAQDQRRDWIIVNWPHLIELEQIAAIIARQEPLAHWPTNQSANVQRIVEQFASLAVPPDGREERTLAQIDRIEVDSDPVRRLEHHRDHLLAREQQRLTADERGAVADELAQLGRQLREARRQARTDTAFARYGASPWEQARAARRATLRYDVLNAPPEWVLERLARLDEQGALASTDPTQLARVIVEGALDADRHGSPIRTQPGVAVEVPPLVIAPDTAR